MHNYLLQFDFDNTMTIGNVSEKLHEKFGPDSWVSIHSEYISNQISVEESNILSFKDFNVSNDKINNYILKNVHFRDGIIDFIEYITSKNFNYKIVSSGVDFYIFSSLKMIGNYFREDDVISGESVKTKSGFNVKYCDPDFNEINNDFKYKHTQFNKNQYEKIIYFGDSHTDIKSAEISDIIFATDELSTYLKSKNIDHYYFDNFNDVTSIFKSELCL